MYIHVNINEAGALIHQRYAFTDRFTLVSELLQNARRAGASTVELDYDETAQTLRISDNGVGIEDFQRLLSLYESGWSSEVCATERPFGVGFSQCLYCARHCAITSGAQRVEFDCEAALAQQPIEVIETQHRVNGTCIQLQGVVLPNWRERIAKLCLGFPVNVRLNGEELLRPLALSELDTQPTEIGEVFLLGRDNGWSTTDVMVFLQGFCIWQSPFCFANQTNVVHLDPHQFIARLPDRDKLVDEDVQVRRIKETLQQCWDTILRERLEELGESQFLERYYFGIRRWQQWSLLNSLALLPRDVCQFIDAYPVQHPADEGGCLRRRLTHITRHSIENKDVQLITLNPLDDLNGAWWMFARERGYVLCDHQVLDDQHWVHAHVLALDEQLVTVTAQGEQQRTWFDGRWVSAPVVLCEVVHVQIGDTGIDLVDEGVCHDAVLYIPCGEWSGVVVRQASSYVDEYERHHEADASADEEALAELIRHLRGRDPQQTLHALLNELQLSRYPALQHRQFLLSISVEDDDLLVECLGATGDEHAQS